MGRRKHKQTSARCRIRAHEFNIMGQPIGKIIDPCPGHAPNPTTET